MEKILDKLKLSINNNKRMIIFFSILIIIGIIAGSFFSVTISSSDKSLVSNYLENFFLSIKNGNINYYETLLNALLTNTIFIVIIWLLGFSVIGLPITLFMFFSKAFSLGFSISSLIMSYKFKGIIYSFFYIIPCQILYFLGFSILMIYSVTLSLKLFSSIVKKKNIDFKHIVNRYLFIMIITFIIIILSSLLETFIMPLLMKLATFI